MRVQVTTNANTYAYAYATPISSSLTFNLTFPNAVYQLSVSSSGNGYEKLRRAKELPHAEQPS